MAWPSGKLAISDNNTTGQFLKQEFSLDVVQSASPDSLVAEVAKRVDEGIAFIVADVSADTLLKMADAIKDKDAVIFNAAAPDEVLRRAVPRQRQAYAAVALDAGGRARPIHGLEAVAQAGS